MFVRSGLTLAAAAALGSVAQAQQPTGPEPLASPATWITPSDYPAAAIRAQAEGRVVAELGIDAAGKVTSCRVTSSSGSAPLDAATCAVMTGRGRFKPGTDAAGRAVASKYTLFVRWSLPKDAGSEPIEVTAPGAVVDMDMAVELSLNGEGKVLACRVLAAKMPGPTPASVDPCEPYAVGRPGGPPLRRAGKPVASKVVQRMTRQVTLER